MRLRLTHTTRLLITLLALVVAWIAAVGLAPAACAVSSQSAARQMAYTYDNLGTSTELNTVAERGPPGIAYDYDALRLPVDTASHGRSARHRPAPSLTRTHYAHPALPAEFAGRAATTRTAFESRATDVRSLVGASRAANAGRAIPFGAASDDAWRVFRVDAKGSPLPGYKGGKVRDNNGTQGAQILPRSGADGSAITYREWDLTQKVKNVDRDGRRLVTGSDGSAYYTTDHYVSFIQIR